MELTILGYRIALKNNVTINLKYDSVASSFSVAVYFDPNNKLHRRLFKPNGLNKCTITHGGVLLLTGRILGVRAFRAQDPPVRMVMLSGASVTEVLQKCPCKHIPLQSNNLSFGEICAVSTKYYKIPVVIDEEVKDICSHVYTQSCPDVNDTVLDYLDKMAKQLGVVISHTPKGELLLTKSKADKLLTTKTTFVVNDPTPVTTELEGSPVSIAPVNTQEVKERAILYHFDGPTNKWVSIEHEYNGQDIHSDVTVVGQGTEFSPNGVQGTPEYNGMIDNTDAQSLTFKTTFSLNDPMPVTSELDGAPESVAIMDSKENKGNSVRPLTYVQSSGDEFTVQKTARAIIGDELKAVSWSIDSAGWVFNGHMATPNQMVTAREPHAFLYRKTKLFIQEVILTRDERNERSIMRCVLPECFNTDTIKDIYQ